MQSRQNTLITMKDEELPSLVFTDGVFGQDTTTFGAVYIDRQHNMFEYVGGIVPPLLVDHLMDHGHIIMPFGRP